MRNFVRPAAIALGIAGLAAVIAIASTGGVLAQAKQQAPAPKQQAAPPPQAQQPPAIKQIAGPVYLNAV